MGNENATAEEIERQRRQEIIKREISPPELQ